jgi:hypothetical protein
MAIVPFVLQKLNVRLFCFFQLSGGVNLARAVEDEELSEEIATAVRNAALALPK